MTVTSKLVLSLFITAGTVMVVRHGADALKPIVPRDMPANAYFVQEGYDVDRNEPTGDWIACRADGAQNADYCRVTDARGSVIYQGDFLPVNGSDPVPASELKIAVAGDDKIWVNGPAEGSPVPVLPLADGNILVPADDSYALGNRWTNNPEELHRIQGE
jgi:hypothetical protein